jgi:hypothetical protein
MSAFFFLSFCGLELTIVVLGTWQESLVVFSAHHKASVYVHGTAQTEGALNSVSKPHTLFNMFHTRALSYNI